MEPGGATRRRQVLFLGKIVISLALIYWILRDASLDEVSVAIRSANLALVGMAIMLNFAGIAISTHRWRLLLKVQKVEASASFLFKSFLIGIFFNNFLPSTIGGDASRVYDSARLAPNKNSAVVVVFLDRCLGLLALILFALIALPFSNVIAINFPLLYLGLLLSIVSVVTVVWSIFSPSLQVSRLMKQIRLPLLQNFQDGVAQTFQAFQGQKSILVQALGLSLLLQANVVLHYHLIARALNLPVSLSSFFVIVPLAVLLAALPISINAVGVRENIFAFFLGPFGVSNSEALAFAWIVYSTVLLQGVIGGVVYMLRK